MWNPPADLSPETAAWIQAQAAITTARAAARLQADIDRAEDRVSGVVLALAQLLPHLVKADPELRRTLGRSWAAVAHEVVQIEDFGKRPEPGITIELLEARDVLFQALECSGLWGDALDPVPPASGKPAAKRGQRHAP